jgi:hypothetical protein
LLVYVDIGIRGGEQFPMLVVWQLVGRLASISYGKWRLMAINDDPRDKHVLTQ